MDSYWMCRHMFLFKNADNADFRLDEFFVEDDPASSTSMGFYRDWLCRHVGHDLLVPVHPADVGRSQLLK